MRRVLLGRPVELDGVVVAGRPARWHARLPDGEPRARPGLLVPRYGIYAGAARPPGGPPRGDLDRDNPHYGGQERRVEPYLLDFEGDLYGQRLVVELWERLRDERAFASEDELSARSRSTSSARARRTGRRDPCESSQRAQVSSRSGISHGVQAQRVELSRVTKLETIESVRCLGCDAVYAKPCGGGTISTNPGCPHCGYLGWAIASEPVNPASLHGRSGAGHPRNRSEPRC